MEERLQKIIAAHGGVSRRAAEELISCGRVSVNGTPAVLGQKADPERDDITIDGKTLDVSDNEYVYIMLNKPVGYVTTMSDEKGRKTVADLVKDIPQRLYPVGRLDINSDGLLIMTNDGEFANMLMHPSFEKTKTYRVIVTGDINKGVQILKSPMELDGLPISEPKVKLVRELGQAFVLDITIHEGRNRQIRRMCEAAGLRVSRLTRISEGNVHLGKLKKGTWRYLTSQEIDSLCNE